jgi:hypothetical protein
VRVRVTLPRSPWALCDRRHEPGRAGAWGVTARDIERGPDVGGDDVGAVCTDDVGAGGTDDAGMRGTDDAGMGGPDDVGTGGE